MFYYTMLVKGLIFSKIYEIAISLVDQLFRFDSANLDRLSVELFGIPMGENMVEVGHKIGTIQHLQLGMKLI